MKILLLDNAIDSLEWAVRHLESFLEKDSEYVNPDESTTYLKQAILCLNSALELFFKAKISEINPILIYDNLSTKDMHKSVLEYYIKKQSGEIDCPLYDYVIENADLHTIEYSKCIELFCALYSVGEGYKNNFIEINQIRNDLTHLGIKSKSEYYKLAGQLAEILFFLQYKLLPSVAYNEAKIEQIYDSMFSIQYPLALVEDRIWATINMDKIESICEGLKKVFDTSEVQDYAVQKKVSVGFDLTLDAEFMYSVIDMEYKETRINIAAIYSSGSKEALIICDHESKDGPIYGVIELNTIDLSDLSKTKFYLSQDKDGTIVKDYDKEGLFWRNDGKYKKSFAYVPFSKAKQVELMKKIIDNIENIEVANL